MTGQDKNKKRIIAVVLLFVFFLAGRQLTNMELQRRQNAGNDYPMSRDLYLLDTYCMITSYEGGGKEALAAAADALDAYDAMMNYNREGSDIYKINHRTSDRVEVSEDTAKLLMLCREFCEESGGILEPAIRPVTSLWDFKEEKKVPEEAELKEALGKVRSLQWTVEGNEFVALDEEVRIDVGAVAKGFIADRVKEVMLENGITSGIINLGGNVLCIGKRPDGKPFSIGVRDPEDEKGYAFALESDDGSVVTAGAYERSFIEDGVRYHHILDPATGYPARTGLESVTVTGPESAVCDGLSTTLFIMGEEKGREFLDSYNQEHGTAYQGYFLNEKAGQK